MSKFSDLPNFLRHARFCYGNVLNYEYLPLTRVMFGYVVSNLGFFTTSRRLERVNFKDFSVTLNALSGEISGYWENFQDEKYGQDADASHGLCVLDVGGNAGFFSMRQIILHGPRLKLYTFEPDPSVYERLSEHLAMCNQGRNAQVSVNNFACGSASGTAGFVRDGSCLSHVATGPAGEKKHIDVRIETLDNVVSAQKIEHIDLIKIDVEGHELEVLKGGAHKALPITDKIVLQYHPGQYENVRELLEAAGFRSAGGVPAKETAFFSKSGK